MSRGVSARWLCVLLLLSAPTALAEVSGALTRGQQSCVDGLAQGLGVVDREAARQIAGCLANHAKGKPLDAKDPAIDTLEECAAADSKGRIGRALERATASYEKRCTPPPTGQLEDPFPEFGATDAARVGALGRGAAPDLAHELFGPDLDLALATDPAAAKCQGAVWKAITRCHQARTAAFRGCQKKALRGTGAAPPADTRDALRESCLGAGATGQPDPNGQLARRCSEEALAKATAKACNGQDLAGLVPGCIGSDPAACLELGAACGACRQVSSAGDLRRSCDLFDSGIADGTCGGTSIACASPADGAMVAAAPGAALEFAGQVPDTSQVESVTVDGVAVELDAEGFFSVPLTAEYGVRFLEIAALDETGAEATRICSFLAAGQFAAEDALLPDALSLTLAASAIHDGSSGDLDSLGDVLQAVVDSPGLRTTLHGALAGANPLKNSCDWTVCVPVIGCTCVVQSRIRYVDNTIGPGSVALAPVAGGLSLAAEAIGVEIELRVDGTVSGIGFDTQGTLTADRVGASLISDVSVAAGALEAELRADSLSSQVGTITPDFDGLDGFVVDAVVSLANGLVRSTLEDLIEDFATSNLGEVLDDVLANLAIPAAPLDVPRPGGAGAIALSLSVEPSSVSVTPVRALIGAAVGASAPPAHAIPSLGVALPPGAVLGEPGTATPLAFAGYLGGVNDILHALWRGGLLHGHVDAVAVPDLPVGVEADFEALLPPVVSVDGSTGLVQLGALRVVLTYPDFFAAPVLLSLGAEAEVELDAADGALSFVSLTPTAVHVSGVDEALTLGDQIVVEVIATSVLTRLLEAALEAAATGLPVLAFELPDSVAPFGLPAGSRMGVVGAAVDLTPSHIEVEGSFGVLAD